MREDGPLFLKHLTRINIITVCVFELFSKILLESAFHPLMEKGEDQTYVMQCLKMIDSHLHRYQWAEIRLTFCDVSD